MSSPARKVRSDPRPEPRKTARAGTTRPKRREAYYRQAEHTALVAGLMQIGLRKTRGGSVEGGGEPGLELLRRRVRVGRESGPRPEGLAALLPLPLRQKE